jgi:hypothetical protein
MGASLVPLLATALVFLLIRKNESYERLKRNTV